MSLRLRLLVALVPLFILGLAAADVATYASLQSFLLSRVDEQVTAAHIPMESYLNTAVYGSGNGPSDGGSGGGDGRSGGSPQAGPQSYPRGDVWRAAFAVRAVLKEPVVQLRLDQLRPPQPAHQPGAGALGSTHACDGQRHGRHQPLPGARRDGQQQLRRRRGGGDPLDDVNATLTQLLILELAVSGAVTLVLALAAFWIIVRRSLRPLERMGETARSIVSEG